jgi:hypothetical protein
VELVIHTKAEQIMYIGVGTIVLIIVVVVLVRLVMGRR